MTNRALGGTGRVSYIPPSSTVVILIISSPIQVRKLSFKAWQFLQDTKNTESGPEISQRIKDWCQEVTAEVSPMMHHPHAWSLVAPPLPSRCGHPLAGKGVPQPCDTGLMAAITPSQPLAQLLPTLCPLPTDNKLRARAWTRQSSACRACVDAKGPCNIQGGSSQ